MNTPASQTKHDFTSSDEGENNSREYLKEILSPIKNIVERLEGELVMGDLRSSNISALVSHLNEYVITLQARTEQIRYCETIRAFNEIKADLHDQGFVEVGYTYPGSIPPNGYIGMPQQPMMTYPYHPRPPMATTQQFAGRYRNTTPEDPAPQQEQED